MDDLSPSARAGKATDRLKKARKKNQHLLKHIVHFIRQIDRQMLYLNLIKEDKYNPWLEIVKAAMLQSNSGKIGIPLAYQFYLTGNY